VWWSSRFAQALRVGQDATSRPSPRSSSPCSRPSCRPRPPRWVSERWSSSHLQRGRERPQLVRRCWPQEPASRDSWWWTDNSPDGTGQIGRCHGATSPRVHGCTGEVVHPHTRISRTRVLRQHLRNEAGDVPASLVVGTNEPALALPCGGAAGGARRPRQRAMRSAERDAMVSVPAQARRASSETRAPPPWPRR